MATSSVASGSVEPDMVLINELMEEISRNPPAVEARKLLVEQFIAAGWLEAASDAVKELKQLAPQDPDVKDWSAMFSKNPATPKPAAVQPAPKAQPLPAVTLPDDLDDAKQDFSQGYKALQSRARTLVADLLHLRSLRHPKGVPGSYPADNATSKQISDLQGIADGKLSSVVRARPPGSARSVARAMQMRPEEAVEIAHADLEDTARWLRAPHGKPSSIDNDGVREALVKRVRALVAALPDNLQEHPETALMHIEHESLARKYVNDESMLGDRIIDVPRANFWVTEDNYAWDMEELAQAITSNGGVMRNPLSRQMFTPKDIRAIVQHPMGKHLAALAIEQSAMSKGVRPETIEHLEKLAKVLLDDQSSDQLPSRHAIDEFMAHCAILPEAEQKALNGLRCPAKDSHTGQPYDFSIGEAVRDAKGNRVCFHKTGDFLKQAAEHLRKNRGAPTPAQNDKCLVM
ncbi:hypothetical protein K432DRAFT_413904 [Lepidopterella palustris CBS 459.81]|uniref:Uncharacterized protein n=1 Tax=Lepidopterella palustris CBS 459.81 TaxID=1314670 RepID=A0A8E2EJA0_9PEZI|nr:hypothetical protein K432DRAFT_413904 [Lepidopterella palustris CBS 459.81]